MINHNVVVNHHHYHNNNKNNNNNDDHLIRNLPCLKALEVLVQHLQKSSREFDRNIVERSTRNTLLHNALKSEGKRTGGIVERSLKGTHGFEDVRWSVRDHIRRQTNSHIDVSRCSWW